MITRRLAFILVVVSACGGDASPHATIRDSAGVAIVSLTLPDRPPSLELVPLDTIGDSPDDVLYQVRGAAFLPDGGLAVGVEGEQQIRVYGPDGRRVRTLGRGGGGPCELRRVHVAGVSGDSVVVSDRSSHRITLFDLHGDGCRTLPLAVPERASPFPTWVADVLAGHALVSFGQISSQHYLGDEEVREGIMRVPRWAAVVDAETGEILTDLGDVGANDLTLVRIPDGPVALLGRTRFGASINVETHDSLIYLFDSRRFEIRAVDRGGSLRRIVRVADWTPRPVDPEARERWLEQRARRADAEGGDYRQAYEMLSGIELPETMAAYRRGLVDDAERIWVDPYTLWDGAADHWVVIEADGRVAGTAALPYDVEILAITADELAVLERGPMNEEYIVRYRVDGL